EPISKTMQHVMLPFPWAVGQMNPPRLADVLRRQYRACITQAPVPLQETLQIPLFVVAMEVLTGGFDIRFPRLVEPAAGLGMVRDDGEKQRPLLNRKHFLKSEIERFVAIGRR